MASKFAIITFRASGPIKTWSDLRGANVHNARTKPIEHAVPGAPAPRHLIGTGDVVADVRRCFQRVELSADRLRKNGVLAYEAVMTASPSFFEAGSPDERSARLRKWTEAQKEFALERWGRHRVASMVLHLDEKTPHIHVVVVPLEVKQDRRRKDKASRWSLVGRMISGPGRFDDLQDAYAAAMEPFGLTRGVRGSGRKHEPVPVYLRRLAEKEQSVDLLQVQLAAERTDLAALRASIERDRIAVQHEKRELEESRRQLAMAADVQRRVDEDQRRRFAADQERLRLAQAEHQDQVKEEEVRLARLAAELRQAATTLAADEVRNIGRTAELKTEEAVLADAKGRLLQVYAVARDFQAKARAVPAADLSPRVIDVTVAAHRLLTAGRTVQPARSDIRPAAIAAFAASQQHAASQAVQR